MDFISPAVAIIGAIITVFTAWRSVRRDKLADERTRASDSAIQARLAQTVEQLSVEVEKLGRVTAEMPRYDTRLGHLETHAARCECVDREVSQHAARLDHLEAETRLLVRQELLSQHLAAMETKLLAAIAQRAVAGT
jgi:hypothetical protein